MREGRLLSHIFDANNRLPGYVTIPPGDDMAGLRLQDNDLLITVDQLADGVHFRLSDTPLELIGRKAITRNLSDVAAMAALPVAAVAAAALPRSFTQEQANRLFDAMRQTAEQFHCPLVGGDITIHDAPLILTVTVLATPAGIGPIRRSGARPGDWIAVTGRLGCAWFKDHGRGDHLTFEPRIHLARKLAAWPGIELHSMIDLSDGLASDLGHIGEQSRVAARIEAARVPLRDGAALHNALCDGEDYELLLTFSATDTRVLPERIDGVPVTIIGQITAGRGMTVVWADGRCEPLSAQGWEHTGRGPT